MSNGNGTSIVALPSLSSALHALPHATNIHSIHIHQHMYAQRAAESEAKVCTRPYLISCSYPPYPSSKKPFPKLLLPKILSKPINLPVLYVLNSPIFWPPSLTTYIQSPSSSSDDSSIIINTKTVRCLTHFTCQVDQLFFPRKNGLRHETASSIRLTKETSAPSSSSVSLFFFFGFHAFRFWLDNP